MPESSIQNSNGDTRERLLRAGVRVFAELGFEPASTRHLASQAGVNLAAIPYYFENKKGLYIAVAEYVAEQIGQRMLPQVETVAAVVADPSASDEQLRAALHGVFANMARLLMGEPDAEAWAAFILREQANPTEAFDILWERVMGRLFEAVIGLTARLTGEAPDDPHTRLRAVTLVGQLLVFRTSRAGVMRSLGWDRYTSEKVALVQALIAEQVDLIVAAAGRNDG